MSSRLANLTKTATEFSVSENTVRNWIARGYFPAYRIKGRRGIYVDLREARVSLAGLPRSMVRPNYGTYGPRARIKHLDGAER